MDEATLFDLRDLVASWDVSPPLHSATRQIRDLVGALCGVEFGEQKATKPTTLEEHRAAAARFGGRIGG